MDGAIKGSALPAGVLGAMGVALGALAVLWCAADAFACCDLGPNDRRDRAVLDVRTIRGALSLHSADGHLLPDSATGLQALVKSGHLEKLPIDPWNRPYHYARGGGLVQIASYGADGVPGGSGNDADLVETFSATEVASFWTDAFHRGAQ